MSRIADGYEAFLFDLDGVLYRGSSPVAHAADAVATLRRLGKRLAFVTNNSARSPEEVAARLAGVGVSADPREIVTSGQVTADLLASRGVREAFVVGEAGLIASLAARGIRVLDDTPSDAEVVVVGLDRAATYEKLRVASILVERGARLVASNPDRSFPAADGHLWPGAGALLAAVEATTGVRAEVVGKPHAPIFTAALDRAGGGRPLVVGDRLDTDIEGAHGLGWDSALVLTGVSTRADVDSVGYAPTYVMEDLSRLVEDG